MKILFVGVFQNKWSTTIRMVKELKMKGHEVKKFDFRNKQYDKKSFLSQKNKGEGKINGLNANNNNSMLKIIRSSYIKFLDKIRKSNKLFYKPIIYLNKFYFFGNWKLQRRLLYDVRKNNYDLIFLAKVDTIRYKIISKMNKFAKTWYFYMDPLKSAIRINAQKYASLSTWSSATFSSVNSFFKRYGANSYFITQGVNTQIFKPGEYKSKKNIDVIFVGSKTPKREKYVNFLKKNNLNIICYGSGWKNKSIYLDDLVNKYRDSKIVLNFTKGNIGFSIRVFQVMGTGCFLISEYCQDLERFFKKGVHLEWFKTPNELFDLVNYYLRKDILREQIANQGFKYVIENFSWDNVMDKIMNIIKENINMSS